MASCIYHFKIIHFYSILRTEFICVINKMYFLLKGTMDSIVILTIVIVTYCIIYIIYYVIVILTCCNHENWADFLEHREVITHWGAAVLMNNYNITIGYCVRRILTLLKNIMNKPLTLGTKKRRALSNICFDHKQDNTTDIELYIFTELTFVKNSLYKLTSRMFIPRDMSIYVIITSSSTTQPWIMVDDNDNQLNLTSRGAVLKSVAKQQSKKSHLCVSVEVSRVH